MEKVKCSTPDFAVENAKKLLALFPECEGQKGEVDIDKLRQVLSSTAIEGNVERRDRKEKRAGRAWPLSMIPRERTFSRSLPSSRPRRA